MKRKLHHEINEVRDCVIGLGLAFVLCSFAALASNVPGFDDYPVKKISKDKIMVVDLKSHPKAGFFRSHLSEVKGRSANFAGHYVVVTWGCGTSCQTVALVEVKSGKIYFAPFSTGLGSDFRVDSSLFVDSPPPAIREYYGGSLDVPNRLFFSFYYVWDEKETKFRLVHKENDK